ncbi:hypothetical protein AURANDRAFT_65750 [Aureococcus anophagefferens]|uniref:subtilisin n=1 Tax=Aureococcus anophagefferens TaxID=44056 RepID=F0YF17_AURAN|nr:hypothetical protein AURANDRAFT_65750 [Aureococcus anophagefferens]EGB06349.1 hypothetical protein AURANDRAFT_65750 [Aureococcus anophagefferens]|eukprot:XP_009038929.1 hypothetical protein AURANDRAFT_65750 [Aureococcus anophagefferens]
MLPMLRVLAVAALASAMVPRTMERVVQTAKKEAAAGTLDGTVKMKLKRSAGAEAPKVAARVAEAMGCAPPRRVFRPAGKHELKHVRAGLDLHYSTDCAAAKEAGAPGTSAKPKAGRRAVWALESLARTDRALLDAVETLAAGLAIQRTGYDMDDPLRSAQTHYDAINLDEAWEMGAGDPSIVVAVVDTGMDMDHPDLQKNVWVNDGEICGNGVDDDKNGYVDDCYGYNFADDKGNGDLFGDGSHGTHCAGTIAADNDNDLYVSGVAGGKNGNAGASLMTLVAFGQVSYGGFAEGIVYAADNGAKIVSNSWGYTAPDQYAEDELAAIDYADDLGVAVVFAAGNAGTDENWYPAYYDRAIAVAAVDDDGVAAYFTCFGDWIDVSAPGVGVLSTVAMSEGATDYYDGTSMACPHVAGLLALGWAIDPSRSKDDVLDCLYGTATDLDDVNGAYAGKLGAGLIAAGDFAACMKNGAPSAAPTLSLPPTRYPTTASPTATFSPTDYGCGRCDLVLTLVLVTDQYPEETGWSLSWDNPGGCRGDATARKSAGAYGAQYTKYTETVEGLCAGFEYTFTIADTYGDGILEGGSYVVTVGGADVAAGATFQYSESTVFVAQYGGTPAPSATPAPTYERTPAPTTKPVTPLPTSDMGDCVVDYPDYVGDGYCDAYGGGYNTEACGWDGGDCCFCTCDDGGSSYACGPYDCRDPDEAEPSCEVDDGAYAYGGYGNYGYGSPYGNYGNYGYGAYGYDYDYWWYGEDDYGGDDMAPTPSSGYVAGLAAWGQTAEAVVVSWESDVWQESAYSFKVGVAREGGDMSWSYPACQASGQGAFFHVLTAADGLECGESYEILVMQGDAQTETIVARTLACDGSDDDAACVCDCGSDYEEDDCADSTSWYYKKSKDTCSDYVTKKSKNCKKKDEFKVKAEDASAAASLRARACPLTCGVCSSSDCEDSTSWYYKKSKDTCADYVTKKSKNCKKYGVDDVLAEDACPVTCGAC